MTSSTSNIIFRIEENGLANLIFDNTIFDLSKRRIGLAQYSSAATLSFGWSSLAAITLLFVLL